MATKQDMHIGQIVKIGFLGGLEVVAKRPCEGGGHEYELAAKSGKRYALEPYRGLFRDHAAERRARAEDTAGL